VLLLLVYVYMFQQKEHGICLYVPSEHIRYNMFTSEHIIVVPNAVLLLLVYVYMFRDMMCSDVHILYVPVCTGVPLVFTGARMCAERVLAENT
jgi:hypothetical protein